MKTILTSAVFFSTLILARADMQTPFPLWPDGAPGALGTNANDIPTLTAYLPDATNATGAAMVICPGGGYEHLAPHEGNDYALWLNQHGVTCFVLKYRLGSTATAIPPCSTTPRARCAGCGRTRRNTKLIRIASASWVRRRAGIWRRRC